MRVSTICKFAVVASLVCLLANKARAQWVQQQIVLRPGWNAVFLEIDPTPQDCDALFAGLPIESVWDWNEASDSVQFVQDLNTLVPETPGWLTWFPPNHPLSGQARLFALRDGRPYLIKNTNSTSVTLSLKGRPSLRRLAWRAGGANLVGFHVATPGPTLLNLVAGQSGLVGQPIYTLDSGGTWRSVLDVSTTRAKPGEAYWIRCKSPAQAAGTVVVDAGSRQGLTFSPAAAEQSIRIRNASANARNVSVRLLASATPPSGQPALAGSVPLEYWRASYATTNFGWEPLSGPLTFNALGVGQEWNIRLGVRRSALAPAAPGATYQSLLEVTDDAGTRWLVPVTAEQEGNASSGFQAASGPASEHAGLWVGDVVLNAVSQPAHPGNPTLPRPSGGKFSFRLMVHVDAAGSARLLQQVFLVRKPPVMDPDPENPEMDRVVVPARTVAVSDESMIPGIIGTAQLIGRRLSSPVFGFRQPVAFGQGTFNAGTLQASVTMDYDDPLNPFKHIFHPDHNNLDERFEQTLPEGKEAFTVTRNISLEFTATDPLGLNPPGWGETEVGGIYRETVSGLHRSAIQTSGNFRLVRVLRAPALNQ